MEKQFRFSKDKAKKIEQQVASYDGPADGQGIEIKSPGKMHWFRIAGETFEDIPKVWTTKLYDVDGEELEYLIMADDPKVRDRIFEACDFNQNFKAIVRCINWFEDEFLWLPSLKSSGNSTISKQSSEKAIRLGQKQWIKCKWKSNSVGWVSWKHPGTDKIPQWGNTTDEELINQLFEQRIITDPDHEALKLNQGISK